MSTQAFRGGGGIWVKPIARRSRSLNRFGQLSMPAAKTMQLTGWFIRPNRSMPWRSGSAIGWAQCPSGEASGPEQHQMCPSSCRATATKLSGDRTVASAAGNRKMAMEPSPDQRLRYEFVRAATTVRTISAGAAATSSTRLSPRVAVDHSVASVLVRASTSRSRAAASDGSGRAVTPSICSVGPATRIRAVKCCGAIG